MLIHNAVHCDQYEVVTIDIKFVIKISTKKTVQKYHTLLYMDNLKVIHYNNNKQKYQYSNFTIMRNNKLKQEKVGKKLKRTKERYKIS